MRFVGVAKPQLGADIEAVGWLRRRIEANRNRPLAHFALAAALGVLGTLDEARAAARAGLALNPGFIIRRLRAAAKSTDNPNFLAGLERTLRGHALGRGTGEDFGTRRSAGLDSITSVRNSAERKCCPLWLQRDRDDREAR
jgi:hypothetical protein